MDERRHAGIGGDAQRQRRDADEGCLVKIGGADAADEPDKRPDRQIEIVDGDDEHLRDGRERDRHRVLEHQIEPHIAHGARLRVEGGAEHDGERQRRQEAAQQAAVQGRRHSRALGEGGVKYLVLAELVLAQFRDDPAITEYIGAVTVAQLIDLGRIPDEGAAPLRFLADDLIDFELGADIDTAHRIVHQHD